MPRLHEKQSPFADVKDLPLMEKMSKEEQEFLSSPEFNVKLALNIDPAPIATAKSLVNDKTTIAITNKNGSTIKSLNHGTKQKIHSHPTLLTVQVMMTHKEHIV